MARWPPKRKRWVVPKNWPYRRDKRKEELRYFKELVRRLDDLSDYWVAHLTERAKRMAPMPDLATCTLEHRCQHDNQWHACRAGFVMEKAMVLHMVHHHGVSEHRARQLAADIFSAHRARIGDK